RMSSAASRFFSSRNQRTARIWSSKKSTNTGRCAAIISARMPHSTAWIGPTASRAVNNTRYFFGLLLSSCRNCGNVPIKSTLPPSSIAGMLVKLASTVVKSLSLIPCLRNIALAEMLEEPGLALAARLDQRRQMARGHDPADTDRHRIRFRGHRPEGTAHQQAQNGPASLHPRSCPDVFVVVILPEPSGKE